MFLFIFLQYPHQSVPISTNTDLPDAIACVFACSRLVSLSQAMLAAGVFVAVIAFVFDLHAANPPSMNSAKIIFFHSFFYLSSQKERVIEVLLTQCLTSMHQEFCCVEYHSIPFVAFHVVVLFFQ